MGGWAIHTHNMTSIHSYERAAEVWEDAESFPKSVHTSWKPLDGHRQEHKRLVKLSEDRGYECVLYNTAMVTYFADGLIALRCHDSISSREFSTKVAPSGCSVVSHNAKMYWEVKTDAGPRYYRESSYPLILIPTPKGNWLLTNVPDTDYEVTYDRKLGAQVQKIVRPYARWHAVAVRMGVPTATRTQPVMPCHHQYLADRIALTEHYPGVAASFGYPEQIREAMYLHTGAKQKTPVPHDRLPRIT